MTPVAEPKSDLIRSDLKPSVPTPLRQSDRVPHHLDRYYDFFIQDGDLVKFDENDEDPITYLDTMQRPESKKWLEAMKSEMGSMYENKVWTLIDLPDER
mgnify:CR=1 FL=1